jgi:hypothetical protein
MKYTIILPLAVMFSCTRNQHQEINIEKETEVKQVSCNFGITAFNRVQRPQEMEVTYASKKSPAEPMPATPPHATIYLDFDGHFVTNTYWNTNGDIHAAPANLVSSEIEKIKHRVSEDFAPFNVTITTNEAVYNQTNPHKRIRVVVTETWQWYGIAGGVAFPNSFQWGNNTPCFVFSTLLSYNEKWIAEAISHEVGHTLSLQHQADFGNNCSLLTEFNSGAGSGDLGWAPIMGSSYLKNVTTWHKGKTTNGCNSVQDEVAILTAILGKKQDEDDATHKEVTAQFAEGVINSSNDVDRFHIDLKEDATVIASPSCIEKCEGANLGLQFKVYRKNGSLVTTVNDPSSLTASTRLPKGKYIIEVETEATPYQDRYGMLGKYHLIVQR